MNAAFARTMLPWVLSLALAACGPAGQQGTSDPAETSPRPVTAQRIINADNEPHNWLSNGRTYDEQRFSPLTVINDANAAQLGLTWHFDIDTPRAMEATPLVVDGVLVLTAPWSVVYALEAATGRLLWTHDPHVPKSWGAYACCDVPNRGAALWGDKVYVATIDGYLVALNIHDGSLAWKVDTIARTPPYTITGAPRIIDGKVIIGNGGAEYGVRGYVSAYDVETGGLLWRTFTVPGNPADGFESEAMAMAAATWTGQWWQYGGGGTAWDSFAYDPELDLLYVGVGNGAPWNREVRSPGGGDNLFLASILALHADSGEYAWHYQTTPGDTWDYTATQHMILADIDFGAGARKVLMQAPKNGFFYVLDRASGELISADPYSLVNWASHVDPESGRPVEIPGARYEENHAVIFPNSWGAHNWHPMAYSPLTGLVYIPLIGGPDAFANWKEFKYFPNHLNTGMDTAVAAAVGDEEYANYEQVNVRVSAWDPVLRREVFRIDSGSGWNAGVLATAGNLLFQGENSGEFAAYRADNGEQLWSTNIRTGIMAPPITFAVDGVQYVTVLGGWGIHSGMFDGDPSENPDLDAVGRVATFRLGGAAQVPAASRTSRELPKLPELEVSATQIEIGNAIFWERCSWCHGIGAVGTGSVPDLRYASPETHRIWNQIVIGGAYIGKGMPDFGTVLSHEEARAVQAYVVEQAQLIQAQ